MEGAKPTFPFGGKHMGYDPFAGNLPCVHPPKNVAAAGFGKFAKLEDRKACTAANTLSIGIYGTTSRL